MVSLHDALLVKDFIAEVSGLSSWLLTSYVMMSRLEFDMTGSSEKTDIQTS